MYFVDFTSECLEHAKQFGKDAVKELYTLQKRMRESDDLNTLSGLDPDAHPYLYRRHAGDFRWIIRDYIAEKTKEKVAIIIDVVPMDKNFGAFKKDPERYGREHFEPLVAKLDLDEIVNRQKPPLPPPDVKPMLNDSETHYVMESVSRSREQEGLTGAMIYESQEWTQIVREERFLSWLPRIRDAIREVYTGNSDGVDDGDEKSEAIPEHENHYIAYQWLHGGKDLFLYDIYRMGHETPKGAIPKNRIKDRDLPFFRAYPVYMLDIDNEMKDEDLWTSMERDRAGNFALSDEEEAFLHAGDQDGQSQFPVFINGRAGSGKSTVLQYLYAEYYARWVRGGFSQGSAPVYFACNGDLLDSARKFVASILIRNPAYCNQKFLKSFVDKDIDGNLIRHEPFNAAFKEFKSFLLELIPEDVRVRNFPADKYVDYARFYKLWSKRFGEHENRAREEYGPEVSWHIIRTFIKGRRFNSDLTPDEYANPSNVSKAQKSVSDKLYKTVYDKVWDGWYKNETRHLPVAALWDDQDLVRYVVTHDLVKKEKKFLGVFCDEAQDFTRVELEALFQLSIFSDRRVYPHQVNKIPYVFAGDEFQTLNPTGFKWDAITSAFTEKFIKGIEQVPFGKMQSLTTDVKANDLIHNYRSRANIVKYCNAVQLLRANCFDDRRAVPQKEWQWIEDEVHPVTYFDESNGAFWTAAMARDDLIVVLPCHKGEEIEYIDNDPVLSQKITILRESGTTIPPTMSAVRVKGLEHTCVAVCGFGKYMCTNGLSVDNSANKDDIPLEYFMNRLYVAVSRARRQLYIVDSENGRRALWDQLSDEMVEKGRMREISNFESVWKGHLAGWEDGNECPGALIPDKGTVDLVKLANDLKILAERDRDPVIMFYAAEFFKKSGREPSLAAVCHAWNNVYAAEEEVDDNRKSELYFAAADGFASQIGCNAKNLEFAVDCLWRLKDDRAFDRMAELDAKYHHLSGSNLKLKAGLAISKKDSVLLGKSISNILKNVRTYGVYDFSSEEWQMVLSRTVREITALPESKFKGMLGALVELVRCGILPMSEKASRLFGDSLVREQRLDDARIFYLAGNLGRATGGPLFREAMFARPYPDNVEFCDFDASEEVEKVVSDYADPANAKFGLSLQQQEAIVLAHLKLGELHKVARLLASISDASFFEKLYPRYGGTVRVALFEAYVVLVLRKIMTPIDALRFMKRPGPDGTQETGLSPRFVIQCMARMGTPPVGDLPDEQKKFCEDIFKAVLNTPQVIKSYNLWDDLLRAGYLFADKDTQNEINLRCGGRVVAKDGKDVRLSGWDEFLSDILTASRLAATSDVVATTAGQSDPAAEKTDLGIGDASPELGSGEDQGPIETPKNAGSEKVCDVYFALPPMFKYLTDHAQLNLVSRDDPFDQWWVDRDGIHHNNRDVGKVVQLTSTMCIEVSDKEIEVRDDSLGINFKIAF